MIHTFKQTTKDKEIKELESKITELKVKQKEMENLKEDEVLAILMHDKLCCFNHTDECGWYYRMDWTGEKQVYLNSAHAILQKISFDNAKAIMEYLP